MFLYLTSWFQEYYKNQDMSNNTLKLILEKEKKRQKLILELLEPQKMIRGSFCKIRVKCGKKNCHCQHGEGHLHQRMSLHKSGKAFQRAVPKEDHFWAEEMTNNYRDFRDKRKEIASLEKEVKELLDTYEELVTNESKKGKPYLEV